MTPRRAALASIFACHQNTKSSGSYQNQSGINYGPDLPWVEQAYANEMYGPNSHFGDEQNNTKFANPSPGNINAGPAQGVDDPIQNHGGDNKRPDGSKPPKGEPADPSQGPGDTPTTGTTHGSPFGNPGGRYGGNDVGLATKDEAAPGYFNFDQAQAEPAPFEMPASRGWRDDPNLNFAAAGNQITPGSWQGGYGPNGEPLLASANLVGGPQNNVEVSGTHAFSGAQLGPSGLDYGQYQQLLNEDERARIAQTQQLDPNASWQDIYQNAANNRADAVQHDPQMLAALQSGDWGAVQAMEAQRTQTPVQTPTPQYGGNEHFSFDQPQTPSTPYSGPAPTYAGTSTDYATQRQQPFQQPGRNPLLVMPRGVQTPQEQQAAQAQMATKAGDKGEGRGGRGDTRQVSPHPGTAPPPGGGGGGNGVPPPGTPPPGGAPPAGHPRGNYPATGTPYIDRSSPHPGSTGGGRPPVPPGTPVSPLGSRNPIYPAPSNRTGGTRTITYPDPVTGQPIQGRPVTAPPPPGGWPPGNGGPNDDPRYVWGSGGASGNRTTAGGEAYRGYYDLIHNPDLPDSVKNAILQEGQSAINARHAGAEDAIRRDAAATGAGAGVGANLAFNSRAAASEAADSDRAARIQFEQERQKRLESGLGGMQNLYGGETSYMANLLGGRAAAALKPRQTGGAGSSQGTSGGIDFGQIFSLLAG